MIATPLMDARMRHAKLVFAISHSENAGAQVIWADLASAFHSKGHDVSLIAIYPGRTGTARLSNGMTWTHCVEEKIRSKGDALVAMRRAFQCLDTAKADVIFTALPAANVIFPVANSFVRNSAKVFISHHSPVSTYNWLLEGLDGWIGGTRAVDGVLCVSHSVEASLAGKSTAYRAKTRVIRNALSPAIETCIDALRSERRSNHRSGRKVIACGRLAEEKNYPVLIRAMAHVADAHLEIIGTGPDETDLRSLAMACGVADRVIFAGPRSREETLASVARSDVFVQPSLFEGHSIALIEAARIGIPMVVSNVSSQLEAITRRDRTPCALTHDPRDHVALAASISLLLADPEMRNRYGALAESLGNETKSSEMVDAYEALLHGAGMS